MNVCVATLSRLASLSPDAAHGKHRPVPNSFFPCSVTDSIRVSPAILLLSFVSSRAFVRPNPVAAFSQLSSIGCCHLFGPVPLGFVPFPSFHLLSSSPGAATPPASIPILALIFFLFASLAPFLLHILSLPFPRPEPLIHCDLGFRSLRSTSRHLERGAGADRRSRTRRRLF
jgi:hypothetical protein